MREQQDLADKVEREFQDSFEIKDENKRLKQGIEKLRSETHKYNEEQE